MITQPMSYNLEIKEKVRILRKEGYSLTEISKALNIAKSTASLWLKDIQLNQPALSRLKERKILGQYKTSLLWKTRRKEQNNKDQSQAKVFFKSLTLSLPFNKLILAVLFWTEGSKSTKEISFINSDPQMISTFLRLLRACYSISESKFRCLLHAHEYHDVPRQLKYWSQLTNIPLTQFSKTYLKPNTGKRKKTNYPGSLRVRYYDSMIARELTAIYNVFASSS